MPGRATCSGQPAGDPRVVDHRVPRGQPLDEQHLVAVPDAELGVVPDDGVHVLEERHRGVAQRQRRRRAGGQLPHPHPDPHLAVGAARRAGRGSTSSATSRDAVATCSPARRAISDTGSAGSSGVNASRMRTARASEDSPVAVRAMASVCPLSHPLRRCSAGSHAGGRTCPP